MALNSSIDGFQPPLVIEVPHHEPDIADPPPYHELDFEDPPPPPPPLERGRRINLPWNHLAPDGIAMVPPLQAMNNIPTTTQECNQVIVVFWGRIAAHSVSHGLPGNLFVERANDEELGLAMVEIRKLQDRFNTDTLGDLIELARTLATDFIDMLIDRVR